MSLGDNNFEALDYIVLIFSLVTCLIVGVYYAYCGRGGSSTEEFLVGGRNLKVFPVAISTMVSFLSAVTILGWPAEIYSFGMGIYVLPMCQMVGTILGAYIFVPFFYPMKLTSIYEYLEKRFDSKALGQIGALTFILEQVVQAGIISYAPSLAMESFLGVQSSISIIGLGICGTIYTSIGGLKAVVWTDSFQFILIVVGMIGILVRGFMDAGGISEAFQIASDGGRLDIFDLSVDPFERQNLLNFVLGVGLITTIRVGINQLGVQRYSSLSNVRDAVRAVMISGPLGLFVMTMCALCGVVVYAANADCDPVESDQIKKIDQIVPLFVIKRLKTVPGSIGLFSSCILSAYLSSFSSILNSLAAVTWKDFLSRVPRFQKMNEGQQTNVSRILSLVYGVVAIGLAFCGQYLGTIVAATMSLMGIFLGSACGLFLMAMFMPFVNKYGAGVGLFLSLTAIAYMSVEGFLHPPTSFLLPVSTQGCSSDLVTDAWSTVTPSMISTVTPSFTGGDNLTILYSSIYSSVDLERESKGQFVEHVRSLSYLLYPIVGIIIAFTSGIIVSALTGGFSKKHLESNLDPRCIHPWARKCMRSERWKLKTFWRAKDSLSWDEKIDEEIQLHL